MTAKFNYAVKYKIEATCRTPLRTGNTDGDVDVVLRDLEGRPFIQGNSISGALREWLEKNKNKSLVDKLFGGENNEGHLIISEGIFKKAAQTYTRPRLRIDEKTGAAADGGKFDVTHVGAGSKFDFSTTWLGSKEKIEELDLVEEMLSALNLGYIRLGANKGTGFGQVSLKVRKLEYDLTIENDRRDWLDDNENKMKEITLSNNQKNSRVEFIVSGRADNILIKSAVAQYKEDKSYIENLMEGEKAILPGTSIKGAVKARVKVIAKILSIDSSKIDEMFGYSADGKEKGKISDVQFEDVYLNQSQKQEITRIRINRFTGGVMRKHLFVEAPLCAEIQFKISVSDNPVFCMLLLYALRDLGIGLYNIGSGGAIGRGYLQINSVEVCTPDEKKAALTFDQERNCMSQDLDSVFQNWADKMEVCR